MRHYMDKLFGAMLLLVVSFAVYGGEGLVERDYAYHKVSTEIPAEAVFLSHGELTPYVMEEDISLTRLVHPFGIEAPDSLLTAKSNELFQICEVAKEDHIKYVSTKEIFMNAVADYKPVGGELMLMSVAENKTASRTPFDVDLSSYDDKIMVFAGDTPLLITEEEKEVLLRIVEAEATCEDVKGRMLVANVVLNRVVSRHFPNNITDVVFQNSDGVYQFSPIKDKRYWSVRISDKTREAVERVLNGEDESQGALYFVARSMANPNAVKWFDSALKRLFKYGVHEFFTEK